MNTSDYLHRIGFDGPVQPDLPTLTGVLQAHVCTVPFENLDVQLGRPLTTSVENAYAKIVENRRGGWCYEQNGLLGWMLADIGFDVTRVAAAVMRQDRGDIASANHLCLLVGMPGDAEPYLVDAGFGGSLFEPIRLNAGEYLQPPYRLGLQMLDDGYWRFWEDNGEGAFSFDFLAETGDESELSGRCEFLQTDPSSGFVQNLVAQRRTPHSHKTLRGRVLTVVGGKAGEPRILQSDEELVEVLADDFDLHVPEVVDLWPRVLARHEELFPSDRS